MRINCYLLQMEVLELSICILFKYLYDKISCLHNNWRYILSLNEDSGDVLLFQPFIRIIFLRKDVFCNIEKKYCSLC